VAAPVSHRPCSPDVPYTVATALVCATLSPSIVRGPVSRADGDVTLEAVSTWRLIPRSPSSSPDCPRDGGLGYVQPQDMDVDIHSTSSQMPKRRWPSVQDGCLPCATSLVLPVVFEFATSLSRQSANLTNSDEATFCVAYTVSGTVAATGKPSGDVQNQFSNTFVPPPRIPPNPQISPSCKAR
jgi:hypothetical protein